MTGPLDQLVKDLQYAAGAGADRLRRTVAADAKTQLEVGAAIASPGPGLGQLLGRRGGSVSASAAAGADVGKVADSAAAELADGGAALPVGKKR